MLETGATNFETGEQLQIWLHGWLGALGDAPVILAEFDHTVLFARIVDGAIEWAPEAAAKGTSPENLLDLRAFGENGEAHCWRTSGSSFAYRVRTDAAEAGHLDEEQALWGTRAEPVDGHVPWSRLTEERGTAFEVPLACAGDLRGNRAVRLQVRHYIAADAETGLAGIGDSRLVRLHQGG